MWIAEAYSFDAVSQMGYLAAKTDTIEIGSAIMNVFSRTATCMAQTAAGLDYVSNGRFILGLGVSHGPMVAGLRGLDYSKPLTQMRDYLAAMDSQPFRGPSPSDPVPIVLAALGPKMLELAASHSAGAHPYFSSPDHTRMARDVMGAGPLLCVEQKVILESDPDKARTAARANAKIYQGLPNYRNNWLRMGLTEADINDLSDRFIDTTFAWGSIADIQDRIKAHQDAGADHVCLQPVDAGGNLGRLDWACLEALAT